jgi:hypothetical protein
MSNMADHSDIQHYPWLLLAHNQGSFSNDKRSIPEPFAYHLISFVFFSTQSGKSGDQPNIPV